MSHSLHLPLSHDVSGAAHKLATRAILPMTADVALRAFAGTPCPWGLPAMIWSKDLTWAVP